MSVNSGSMRDALYEPPGPRTRRLIRVWTGVGIVLNYQIGRASCRERV